MLRYLPFLWCHIIYSHEDHYTTDRFAVRQLKHQLLSWPLTFMLLDKPIFSNCFLYYTECYITFFITFFKYFLLTLFSLNFIMALHLLRRIWLNKPCFDKARVKFSLFMESLNDMRTEYHLLSQFLWCYIFFFKILA